MGGKKGGENTKKISGNAKKAEVAAQREAVKAAEAAKKEDGEWAEGARSNAKKEAEAQKKAEAARKKAERDALLAAEEKSQPSKPKNSSAKTAPKRTKGTLDLSDLDSPDSPHSRGTLGLSDIDSPNSVYGSTTSPTTLNATGIDNALDALSLSNDANTVKVDRHPERRLKAAFEAYKARRLPGIQSEYPGLRKQQRIDKCWEEFKKSDENPFNQETAVDWDATKEEVADAKAKWRADVEKRLAE